MKGLGLGCRVQGFRGLGRFRVQGSMLSHGNMWAAE